MAFLNGTIRFNMVSIPVKLYSAAREENSGLNLVHAHADGTVTKIEQKNYCPTCKENFEYALLQRGLPQGNGFVVLTTDEIARTKPKHAPLMEITQTVGVDEIDPIYFNLSYYVRMDPKAGDKKAFAFFVKMLNGLGLAGISSFATRGKQHNIIIRAVGNELMIHTLFTADEVRATDDHKFNLDEIVLSEPEIKLGKMLLQSMKAKFDPSVLKDEGADALKALIASKTETTATGETSAPSQSTVASNDLMAQLQASIGALKKPEPTVTEEKPKKTKRGKMTLVGAGA